MCGISGYISSELRSECWEGLERFLPVRQRGPDDEGVCLIRRSERSCHLFALPRSPVEIKDSLPAFTGQSTPLHDVAFFHGRFAIIDPSPAGHQPFASADGSIVTVFNGEIYNYVELRQELALLGVSFRTRTDTEVLVEGYRYWGEGLWPRLNGFWAVALYDKTCGRTVLSRDRLGVAPLYYCQRPEGLYFSSLIQPLVSKDSDLDPDMLKGFVDHGLKDQDNRTLYKDIHSFPAGESIVFPDGCHSLHLARRHRYWKLPEHGLKETDLSFADAALQFKKLFFDAVKIRLRSDVGLAFELSGGLDSSSVVAAAAQMTDKKIVTYTLKVAGRNEEPYARAMTKRYHLDYRVVEGLEANNLSGCEEFSSVMEEPYDTPANYLHHLMLKSIKQQGIHVVVTGAGGDEVLAGYEASFWPKIYKTWRAQGLKGRWQADWYEFHRRFKTWKETDRTLRNYLRALTPGRKVAVSETKNGSTAAHYVSAYKRLTPFEQRVYHFTTGLLPYYLRSTDHYTMNIPVEHRFPFLDYRLVEFGLRLPPSYLFRAGWTKYILRRAMAPDLPAEILWRRKKMGFPFDFERYFAPRETEFGKYLKALDRVGLKAEDYGSYSTLASSDPARLWRLISTGIWVEGL